MNIRKFNESIDPSIVDKTKKILSTLDGIKCGYDITYSNPIWGILEKDIMDLFSSVSKSKNKWGNTPNMLTLDNIIHERQKGKWDDRNYKNCLATLIYEWIEDNGWDDKEFQ